MRTSHISLREIVLDFDTTNLFRSSISSFYELGELDNNWYVVDNAPNDSVTLGDIGTIRWR